MITLTYDIPQNYTQKKNAQIDALATAPIDQGELQQMGLTDVSDPPPTNVSEIAGGNLRRTVKLMENAEFLANFPGVDNEKAAVANLFRSTIESMLATKVVATDVTVP